MVLLVHVSNHVLCDSDCILLYINSNYTVLYDTVSTCHLSGTVCDSDWISQYLSVYKVTFLAPGTEEADYCNCFD